MVVHNAYGYGLFTGGLGFHQGAERLGALVDPGLRRRHRAPGDAAARPPGPGALLHAVLRAAHRPGPARGGHRHATSSRWRSACSARSRGPRRCATQIEAELGLIALNVYGLSEIVGPGVAAECPEARDGLHVQEDHFLVEVVDPDTGERCPTATTASWSSRR